MTARAKRASLLLQRLIYFGKKFYCTVDLKKVFKNTWGEVLNLENCMVIRDKTWAQPKVVKFNLKTFF